MRLEAKNDLILHVAFHLMMLFSIHIYLMVVAGRIKYRSYIT